MTVASAKPESHPYPIWSPLARELAWRVDFPVAGRGPITYQRDFVEAYVPNQSLLVPPDVAEELCLLGRAEKSQTAGAFTPEVLGQLLIDLSWNSSRLEGNRYSRHEAEELLVGESLSCDLDTVMLLNHKAAIEFLVDCVPQEGLSTLVIQNLHALLMQELLPNSSKLGAIRKSPVGISGTLYVPPNGPDILEGMLQAIVAKACLIRNPIEAAFFLWVNVAYLQPFEDGNKRTSRLVANIPLLLHNCMPLSFLDVTPHDYARAMLGVYELQDVALAVDLLSSTYRRSIEKYGVLMRLKDSGTAELDRRT